MARPKLANPRIKKLGLALTRDEFVVAETRARNAGLRLVDYARASLLGEMLVAGAVLTQTRFDPATVEAWKRAGNNLNQVARQLNALQRVEATDVETVLQDLRCLIREAAQHGA